ncbi:MAG: C25 family cysteine peptidase [Candidatus Aminicenantes bacterium]|nr:C25 family cysteine peptidase [Candidatus Aminicenantes bacterium]
MKDFKFQKKQVSICVIFIFLFSFVGSFVFGQDKEIVVNYRIQAPKVEKIKLASDEKGEKMVVYDRIRVENAYNYGEPGEPFLPHKTARILLPPGYEIKSVKVETGKEIQVGGEIVIEPAQVPIPTNEKIFKYTAPNPKIYQSERPFPESIYSKPFYQTFRGFNIVLIEFIPLKYVAAKKSLFYYSSLKIILEIALKKEIISKSLLRVKDLDFEKVKLMIDNPEAIDYYKKVEQKKEPVPSMLAAGDWDMVIVTNSALIPTFQSYADWRTNWRGIRTIVYDISTILSDYSGTDSAEKLRNFIIDAYIIWGIDYVLLGGDVDIIPHRNLYCEVNGGEYIPADIYFAGLDGNWDTNNNLKYGERLGSAGDEADLFPEVYVGRAPVNSSSEANNFCNKITNYEQNNLSTYRCDWLFFATNLSPITFGGNYIDDTQAQELPASLNLNITKVYENLGGTAPLVISALNAGQRVGNSCGHGNTDSFGMINSTDVDSLTNTEYSLIYTWACWTNAFDQSDCIGEHFLYTPHGAFAFIGNSRYGWYYDSGDASGPSHDFELEFYHSLIFEEIPRLGKALQDSKETFNGSNDGNYRWITYGLNLMGDPSTLLRLKNDIWIKTSNIDDGSIPAQGECWTSPDIAVDSPAGGWQTPSPFITHENPEFRDQNRIYVRVRNFGCADANNVTVKVYWADPSTNISWPSGWDYIGSSSVAVIPHGGEVTAPCINWIPTGPAIGHRCLFATIECPSDPISVHNPCYDNNVAQKNVTIVDSMKFFKDFKPFTTEFFLNPTTNSAKRSLTVRVIDAPPNINLKLLIPGNVIIERTNDDRHIKLIKGRTGNMWQVDVDSSTIIENENSFTILRGLQCDKKEKISLNIAVVTDYRIKPETPFTMRITEESDGKVVGGLDYIFKRQPIDIDHTPQHKFNLSLHAGFTLPIKNLSRIFKGSYMFAADMGYHFSPQFSAVALVGFNHFRLKPGYAPIGNTYWWNLSANLKLELSTTRLRPYVNGGFGMYIPKIGPAKPGYNVGAGFDKTLNPPNLVFELGANYHHILAKEVDPQFYTFHAGFIFKL